jgi:hypothetical protein
MILVCAAADGTNARWRSNINSSNEKRRAFEFKRFPLQVLIPLKTD